MFVHRDEDPLIIRLDAIGDEGLEIDRVVAAERLAELLTEGPFGVATDGRLTVRLFRVGGGEDVVVHVQGKASLSLTGTCSRCLGPVALAVEAPFQLALFPLGHEPPAQADGELKSEDMGVATYSGDAISVGELLRDEVFLELPMNPVCSESCAGLCPSCGVNLNETTCDCEKPSNERWNALREIKLS